MSHTSTWILLGASRGLGRAFSDVLKHNNIVPLSYSRKDGGFDFSKREMWAEYSQTFVHRLSGNCKIIYFAGGGPYGNFHEKKFSDHEWSWRVSYEFPAFLLHTVLSFMNGPEKKCQIEQVCFVGSAIAESRGDRRAASYAAAKHALRGLLTSVQLETTQVDIRLFSPGYMNTELLPQNAWPRQSGERILDSRTVAIEMYNWLQDSTYANGHKVFE